ncbi:hypothetical protein CWR41_00545 [Cedecea lapagei]|nr:hypothetical protein CWR41_00545 [Cedecea lapagei]
MWYYRKRAAAGKLDSLNFWLGLNAVPVSQLKGKIKGRGGKRHARRDKRTGRFIKRRKGSAAPTFSPASASLPETTFEDGFVTNPPGAGALSWYGESTVPARRPLISRPGE